MVTVSVLVANSNKKLFHSDGHFCFLSCRQFLYIYRSISHLNWPVMESDLWSLYLFHYLLICLFVSLHWIYRASHIWVAMDNSISCLWWALGVFFSIFYLASILNLFVAPGNKEMHFLLLWVHSISYLYKFNIAAILDSVVAPSNKNSISCKLWASSERSNYGHL